MKMVCIVFCNKDAQRLVFLHCAAKVLIAKCNDCFSEGKKDINAAEEAYILIHALRDANMPKFLVEDVPLFESIMADLFPGMKPPQPDYGALEVISSSLFCYVR